MSAVTKGIISFFIALSPSIIVFFILIKKIYFDNSKEDIKSRKINWSWLSKDLVMIPFKCDNFTHYLYGYLFNIYGGELHGTYLYYQMAKPNKNDFSNLSINIQTAINSWNGENENLALNILKLTDEQFFQAIMVDELKANKLSASVLILMNAARKCAKSNSSQYYVGNVIEIDNEFYGIDTSNLNKEELIQNKSIFLLDESSISINPLVTNAYRNDIKKQMEKSKKK